MNSERHYPIAYKLTSVAMMAFAVWIFYNNYDPFVKLYAAIEFVATLNGWAAAENDEIVYGDLFLLNDACCSACFFLTMLELNEGRYDHFYVYSTVLFVLYYLWNRLLIKSGQVNKKELQRYQKCNVAGFVYSIIAVFLFYIKVNNEFQNVIHIIGMIMWSALLGFWFVDMYFKMYIKKRGDTDHKDDLRESSDVTGFYDAELREWYRIEHVNVNNGLFTQLRCTKTDPSNLGKFILPGFIDAHCHVLENPFNEKNKGDIETVYDNALKAVMCGVTSLRDVGGPDYKSIFITRLLSNYNLSRIFSSGCYFTTPGGHCSDKGAIEISDLDAFINAMKVLADNMIKYCKIIHSDDGFEFSLLSNMIEYAHKCNMIVSTHAYTEKAAFEAVLAGTDTLEHAGDYSDRLLNLIYDNKVIVIPTYVASVDSTPENCEGFYDVDGGVLREWAEGEKKVVPKLFERKINVGLGTDAGFPGTPFDSLYREIELLNKNLGIPIQDILYSAFITTPKVLGMSNKLGKISDGFFADYLVYDSNPLENTDLLSHPSQVWIHGKRVDNLAGNTIEIKKLTSDCISTVSNNLRNYFFDCAELSDYWTESELEAWISCQDDYCIGAFLNNELIGACLSHYHKETSKVHIENIYVQNEYRNQGVAKHLLLELSAHYIQQGNSKIRFIGLVDPTNEPAMKLFRMRGFIEGHPMNWMQLNEDENYKTACSMAST